MECWDGDDGVWREALKITTEIAHFHVFLLAKIKCFDLQCLQGTGGGAWRGVP